MPYSERDIDLVMVDDEKDLLDLAKIFLEKESNRVSVYTTTEQDEVLRYLGEREVDVIVSDYNMPGMNGMELLEEVRYVDEEFPFIVYSGRGEEVEEMVMAAGATDYFQKTTGTEHYLDLAEAIENSAENYWAREEE